MTTHTLTFELPVPTTRMDRIAAFKRRMVAKGYAVTNRLQPMCPTPESRPTLAVIVSKPEVHIAEPIGHLMTWGIVQYAKHPTKTAA